MVYIRSPPTIYCVAKKSCPFIYSEYTRKIDKTSWTHSIETKKKVFGIKSHTYIL